MAGLLGLAPAAYADQGTYLQQIHGQISTPLTDAQAIQLGQVACGAIRGSVNAGLSMGQARSKADAAVGAAQNSMGIGLNMAEGMILVQTAEDQIC